MVATPSIPSAAPYAATVSLPRAAFHDAGAPDEDEARLAAWLEPLGLDPLAAPENAEHRAALDRRARDIWMTPVGGAAGDIPAVHEALLRVSSLVTDLPEIMEMDLNPVKVAEPGRGLSVVDARIKVRPVVGAWLPSRRDVISEL